MDTRSNRRFVVNDIGYAFAVHDTGVPEEYGHPAGADKEHLSSNRLNSRMLEIFPTRERAQAYADKLEERAARSGGTGSGVR